MLVAGPVRAQSLLDRPPNLTGGWVAGSGTLQFNFVHRYERSDPPERKISNTPSFLMAIGLPMRTMVGFTYATKSALSPRYPTEWEFLAALCERADCGVLLDVNNVFVSAHNHGFDARAFLDGIPRGRVGQIHLAGHSQRGELLLDTHDHPVRDEVWSLYRYALERHGPVSTLIEWDDRLPPFAGVAEEAGRARAAAVATLGPEAGRAHG